MNNYTVLHCHTDLSSATTNIDSVTKYEDYIKYASELGMKAIAITEHGNILSWVKKKETCEKYGLKYIHGIEAYLTETIEEKIRDNYHCCLYAKNWDGVKELNKLISSSFNRKDNHFYYAPRILIDDLFNTSDNIIITSACLGGVFNKGNNEIKERFLNFFIQNKHRCFLEIQHHNVEDQISYNKYLYELSKEYDLQLVANTDTHCLNKIHEKGRSILQKAKNIYFDNEEGWDLTFKTYDELIESYKKQSSLPMDTILKAIENTNKIADMIEPFELNREYKYPKLYEDGEQVLKQKINEGILRLGINEYDNYQSEYIPRIYEELETYKHNKAIDFLLLDEDIKSWARSNDMYCGYSRGSCSGSIICYLIGMTDVDSIRFNLNFSRFMNKERVSLADVDTDWSPADRDKVKEYIHSKEGLYCADIIIFNTVALKGSIRDVARALEYPLDLVDEICKNIEEKEEYYREKYEDLFEYVDIINGTIVSIGTHPCFLGDELVLTRDGYKEIKDVNFGDFVYTHNKEYKQVIEVMENESNDIVEMNLGGTFPINTTNNHPFYARKRKEGRFEKYKAFKNPEWIEVKDLNKGDMVGIPVNTKSIMPTGEFNLPYENIDLWWIIGRYLGDGWITEMNRVDKRNNRHYVEKYLVICCNKNNNEKEDIVKVLNRLGFKYSIQDRKTIYRIYIKNNQLLDYLKGFGKYADGKFIPTEILDAPTYILKSLLEGYLSADGHYEKNDNSYRFKTVSKKMALGFINIIAKVYHKHVAVSILKSGQDIIEGRTVNRKEKYCISFKKDTRKQDRSFYENGYIWMPIKSINTLNKIEKTYNLRVIDDNSYTINNIAVHNCGICCSPIPLDENMGLLSLSTCENPVTMLNMKEIDSLNYVKLDVLALDNIQLINETCKLANIERLTPQNIDDNDEKVWMSIREDTTGIFQWEGTGEHYIKDLFSDDTISKIKKQNPNFKFIDLMSVGNGAIRPAGASYRDELSHGIFRDNGNSELNKLLSSTLGYLVYQEQILSFLHEFCGYTMGEADIVRRGFAKKLGTEQYIPRIKEGFIKTMKEKYNTNEKESEKIVESFIQVIQDASSYLFSLNHSLPYSYIGYICGYLRYYYPLEFFTVFLNINKDNVEKSSKALEYMKNIGISLKSPKFRYSKAEYFMDKENNIIYKGIGSIKYMNNIVAEQLYELRDNQYDTFTDLLIDIKNETNCNIRQLDILVKLDFFQEFGKRAKLLEVVNIFNQLYGKKQIKKDKLIFKEELVRQYATTETDKVFKGIDMIGLIKHLESNLPNEDMTIKEIIKAELEYYHSPSYINKELNPSLCCALEINTKYTPVVTFYNIYSGRNCNVKIPKRLWKNNPIKKCDMVYLNNTYQKNKMKKENNQWVTLDEYDVWCDDYEIGEFDE